MEFDIWIRVIAFVSVFGLMASWESLAPRRQLSALRLRRWVANLSVAALNTAVIRLLLASGAGPVTTSVAPPGPEGKRSTSGNPAVAAETRFPETMPCVARGALHV